MGDLYRWGIVYEGSRDVDNFLGDITPPGIPDLSKRQMLVYCERDTCHADWNVLAAHCPTTPVLLKWFDQELYRYYHEKYGVSSPLRKGTASEPPASSLPLSPTRTWPAPASP